MSFVTTRAAPVVAFPPAAETSPLTAAQLPAYLPRHRGRDDG